MTSWSGRVARVSSVLGIGMVLSLGGACKSRSKVAPAQSSGDLSKAVARIDDTVITVGDVQERINKQAPFVRARYTALDKKKEFLENLIRFEVMAKEAERRGYDKDPEVVRVMKQQMISKFLQKDFESKLRVEDVPDADVEKYYREHSEEFNRPEEVRVSQIVVTDRGKAEKIANEARAADRNDTKVFRDLVTKYSEDEDSKQHAGDLTTFDRNTTAYPKPIVEAAFALKEVGDVSPPVKTDKGFHILKLTQKRPGYSRPLPEVKRQIQQRLFRDLRTKALDDLIAGLKKKSKITIDDANLAKVALDTGLGASTAGAAPPSALSSPPGHPMPPGAPGAPGSPGAPNPPGVPQVKRP